jgi:hypothetical protein
MLKTLRLVKFRAFSDFTLNIGDSGSYLVGPNNAGKSTILTALRTADVFLRVAHQRPPSLSVEHLGRMVSAYPISLVAFPALRDSLRYEFGTEEARIELSWKTGARLTAVWPVDDVPGVEPEPFFYLDKLAGMAVRTVKAAKEAFPLLGLVPVLTPVEHSETLREERYLNRNVAGRLSSRHFRNNLRLMDEKGTLQHFMDWAKPWLAEVTFDRLGQHFDDKDIVLEAFFYEGSSRVPKELIWAGDGLQIWLQILFHVYRVRESETIVLDEPEVYLHPDLQRQLVHLLEATERQVVLATHSAEMLTEADMSLVTLVDKSARRGRRARSEGDLEMLSNTLGTAFNLRLARALKSKVALFVEGQDMVMLKPGSTAALSLIGGLV